MDIKAIMKKIGETCKHFWVWIKPYLVKIHHWRKRMWKKFQINKIILLLGMIAVLVTSIYLFTLAKSANVGSLMKGLEESTVIYDQNGDEAGKLFGQKGTFVNLDQISPSVKDALISTEDRNFEKHHGYDIKGLARAVVGKLSLGTIGGGGGGSTITQQLAKNAYLTQEQTLDRKARELFLAIEIEKKYSKDEILEMYLNKSYFGNGVWGIEDASHKYFGVSASELSVGEAATLVGMLKGPSIYNPIDYIDNATNRRNTVLQLMVENEKLAQVEADEQANVDMATILVDNYSDNSSDYRYPYYFDSVIAEAENEYGIKEEDLLNNGYKIYTSLDQNYQEAMQNTYDNDALFPPNAEDGTMVQSGSVALDPDTGGVQAVVGRRGEHVYRDFNFATQSKRSPGSSLKPISVYTPALEAGYKPNSILEDLPQEYYPAENYSRTYSGEVPMYQALGESLNLPAIWLLNKVGLDKGYDKTEKFGISLDKEDKYYGLALGGLKTGVSPLIMANAYAPFANGGSLPEAHFITKIVDSTGAVIVDKTKTKSTQVITKEVSDEITSMLLGVFSSGSGVNADPYGFVMAGKTGTTETNFDTNKTKDQWVIGYTEDVVVATWLGFEQSSEEYYLEGSSATYASTVFNNELQGIMPYTAQTPFSVPDAYATGGDMTATPVTDENNTNSWQNNVKDASGKVQEGAKDIGEKIQEGASEIGGKVKQGWENTKEGVKNFFGGILGE